MSGDEAWFRQLGYEVLYEEGDGWTWASLRSIRNPSFVLPRYGRGTATTDAVARAKRRWEVEQIG